MKDPLRDLCVLMAPARAGRPHDPVSGPVRCPFCPGNEDMTPPELMRIGDPWRVRVFPNKYPATDMHEIVVDSPEHGPGLHDLSLEQLSTATAVWSSRVKNMYRAGAAYVSLFHNRGRSAGASRQHIHTQIIGLKTIPPKIRAQMSFLQQNPDYFDQVISTGFIVHQNQHIVALCPPVPVWPYEVWIVPKRPESMLPDDTRPFSRVLRVVLRAISLALGEPDYNLLVKTMPWSNWRWRAEVVPRTGKLAGFELDTGCRIVSVPPERARDELLSAIESEGGVE